MSSLLYRDVEIVARRFIVDTQRVTRAAQLWKKPPGSAAYMEIQLHRTVLARSATARSHREMFGPLTSGLKMSQPPVSTI